MIVDVKSNQNWLLYCEIKSKDAKTHKAVAEKLKLHSTP